MNFVEAMNRQSVSEWQNICCCLAEPLPCCFTAGETHVWQIKTPLSLRKIQTMFAWLSPQEQVRALQFAFPADRDQYIAAHGMLRLILASYTNQEPNALRFGNNRYGKPRIANCSAISFNMSHSGNRVLLAISSSEKVGIDIERIVPSFHWEGTVRFCFSDSEQVYLYSLPQKKRTEAFFTIWTFKEAYWKARGIGLSGLAADEACLAGDQSLALRQLALDEEYRGAVAVSNDASTIHCFCLQQAL